MQSSEVRHSKAYSLQENEHALLGGSQEAPECKRRVYGAEARHWRERQGAEPRPGKAVDAGVPGWGWSAATMTAS